MLWGESRFAEGEVMRRTLLALAVLFGPALAGAQPPPGVPRTINIFGRQGVTAVVDARTNSLIVAADADTLKEVNKLVTELDKPAKPKK